MGWAVAVALVLGAPLAWLVRRATEQGWDEFTSTLWRRRTLELAGRSIGLAVAVTAASLVIGIGGAWLVTSTDVIGRRLWQVALGLPFVMPSYVAAWGWIAWAPQLAGFWGAVVVLTSIGYPYVYLPAVGALSRRDPALEEVARSAGRGPVRVVLTVVLPQVRVAVVGGGLLVGLYVLSDFGAVSIMRYEALTHVIYRSYRASFDRTPAAVLGLVLVAISLVTVALAVRQDRRSVAATRRAARPPVPQRLGPWRLPAALIPLAVLTVAFAVPLRTIVVWAVRGRSRADWGELWRATLNSLSLGAMAAAVTVVVALPVAVLAARYGGRAARAVSFVAYAGHSLPGIVIALSLVFFGIRVATPFYQRTPLLIFAYVVLFISLALGAVQQAIAQSSPVLDDVARSLGRRPVRAWVEITGRSALPGIASAAALVALATMKELPATLLLRPTGTETLATRLWSHTGATSYAAAAPYAGVIVLAAAVPTAILTVTGSRSRRSDRPRR